MMWLWYNDIMLKSDFVYVYSLPRLFFWLTIKSTISYEWGPPFIERSILTIQSSASVLYSNNVWLVKPPENKLQSNKIFKLKTFSKQQISPRKS